MTSEYIVALKRARERLVPERRACATVLTGEFKRPQSTEAIAMFAALQAAIEALDRAIDDEQKSKTNGGKRKVLRKCVSVIAC